MQNIEIKTSFSRWIKISQRKDLLIWNTEILQYRTQFMAGTYNSVVECLPSMHKFGSKHKQLINWLIN
jgi:hypothetical protein